MLSAKPLLWGLVAVALLHGMVISLVLITGEYTIFTAVALLWIIIAFVLGIFVAVIKAVEAWGKKK